MNRVRQFNTTKYQRHVVINQLNQVNGDSSAFPVHVATKPEVHWQQNIAVPEVGPSCRLATQRSAISSDVTATAHGRKFVLQAHGQFAAFPVGNRERMTVYGRDVKQRGALRLVQRIKHVGSEVTHRTSQLTSISQSLTRHSATLPPSMRHSYGLLLACMSLRLSPVCFFLIQEWKVVCSSNPKYNEVTKSKVKVRSGLQGT